MNSKKFAFCAIIGLFLLISYKENNCRQNNFQQGAVTVQTPPTPNLPTYVFTPPAPQPNPQGSAPSQPGTSQPQGQQAPTPPNPSTTQTPPVGNEFLSQGQPNSLRSSAPAPTPNPLDALQFTVVEEKIKTPLSEKATNIIFAMGALVYAAASETKEYFSGPSNEKKGMFGKMAGDLRSFNMIDLQTILQNFNNYLTNPNTQDILLSLDTISGLLDTLSKKQTEFQNRYKEKVTIPYNIFVSTQESLDNVKTNLTTLRTKLQEMKTQNINIKDEIYKSSIEVIMRKRGLEYIEIIRSDNEKAANALEAMSKASGSLFTKLMMLATLGATAYTARAYFTK
jgi:hypothetical protein